MITEEFTTNSDLNFSKPKNQTRIVVAMSGGVDSSVVACLLHEQGFEVIGITLQLYNSDEINKKKNSCCAGVDIYDAKKVAEKFGFPHYVLNYQDQFKQEVIDNFADSYLSGETPIPCVKCNQSVKFRDLLKVAKELNADALATGHYVRRTEINSKVELQKAIDESKDQSYFLFATTQEQLNFLRFPLGNFTKEFTRKQALRFGLEIALKPDSQDICFVPSGDYAQVIKKYRPNAFNSGQIIHIKTGEILGEHQGIINFTLGQRRGLGISYPNPLYVVKINSKNNQVLVGEEDYLFKSKFNIRDINWLAEDLINDLLKDNNSDIKNFELFVNARIRSNNEEKPAKIRFKFDNTEILKENNFGNTALNHNKTKIINFNSAEIEMKSMTKAITPGQACVLYLGDRVLGGGWIEKEIE